MFFTYHPERSSLLVTVTVGDAYFERWKKNSFESWKNYAEQYDFGIVALTTNLVRNLHPGWNKFRMLEALESHFSHTSNVLVMDADQIFSPIAPNLNDQFATGRIGVVPQKYGPHQKLLSYLRKAHLDREYPLDSFLIAEPHSQFDETDFPELSALRFYSSGFVTIPPEQRNPIIEFSHSGPSDPYSKLDGGGDQIPFLRFLAAQDPVLLTQEWQGIWPEIMATKHPYLYVNRNKKLASFALASSLLEHHCIHFSTTWPEKDFWDIPFRKSWDEIFPRVEQVSIEEYLRKHLSPRLYGQIVSPGEFFLPEEQLPTAQQGSIVG